MSVYQKILTFTPMSILIPDSEGGTKAVHTAVTTNDTLGTSLIRRFLRYCRAHIANPIMRMFSRGGALS